jgi:hypothetical protein
MHRWAERPIAGCGYGPYLGSTMAEVPSNCDLLDWFSEDERKVCSSCGERACVSLPRVSAHFCLACGAATIAGTRLDVHGIRV